VDRFPGVALCRLYRKEGLVVKRRRGRKRARGTRTPMPAAAEPNARWSLDFLSDILGASRRFCILAMSDGLLPREPVPDRRHQHLRG
jgi:hypothetical protein